MHLKIKANLKHPLQNKELNNVFAIIQYNESSIDQMDKHLPSLTESFLES